MQSSSSVAAFQEGLRLGCARQRRVYLIYELTQASCVLIVCSVLLATVVWPNMPPTLAGTAGGFFAPLFPQYAGSTSSNRNYYPAIHQRCSDSCHASLGAAFGGACSVGRVTPPGNCSAMMWQQQQQHLLIAHKGLLEGQEHRGASCLCSYPRSGDFYGDRSAAVRRFGASRTKGPQRDATLAARDSVPTSVAPPTTATLTVATTTTSGSSSGNIERDVTQTVLASPPAGPSSVAPAADGGGDAAAAAAGEDAWRLLRAFVEGWLALPSVLLATVNAPPAFRNDQEMGRSTQPSAQEAIVTSAASLRSDLSGGDSSHLGSSNTGGVFTSEAARSGDFGCCAASTTDEIASLDFLSATAAHEKDSLSSSWWWCPNDEGAATTSTTMAGAAAGFWSQQERERRCCLVTDGGSSTSAQQEDRAPTAQQARAVARGIWRAVRAWVLEPLGMTSLSARTILVAAAAWAMMLFIAVRVVMQLERPVDYLRGVNRALLEHFGWAFDETTGLLLVVDAAPQSATTTADPAATPAAS